MNRKYASTVLVAFLFTGLSGFARLSADDGEDGKVIDGFVLQVDQSKDLDQATKDHVKEIVAKLRGDAETRADAISEGLMVWHVEYLDALTEAEKDPHLAVQALRQFAESSDPFLSADACFHLARILINDEHYEDALPLLESVAGPQSLFTLHSGTSTYFIGVAHAQLLENQQAVDSLSEFLQRFPDAPERLRVAAWRQIQELATVEEGQLADAHQRMDFSRRKLGQEDSGAATQEQQAKIVGILAKLIQDQEKKECSSCNSKKNCQGESDGQAKKPGKKNNDPQTAKNQTGGSSNNPNGVAERTFSDGPASPWSKLRDRSRDPAYSAIKDQLPAKYRDIVERYTEKAQSGQGSSGGSQ